MLLAGIFLGLIAGLLAGGRLTNLAELRLRWLPALFLAVVVRFGTEAALGRGIAIAVAFQALLLIAAYAILVLGLWVNRRQPGISIALVGTLSNGIVIAVNGGRMPIWEPSLAAAGFTAADAATPIHSVLPTALDANFLLHLGPLVDVIPIPLPIVQNVASIGDAIISLGLALFLFVTVLHRPATERPELPDLAAAPYAAEPMAGLAGASRLSGPSALLAGWRGPVAPETGLVAGLSESSILMRPIVLGGPRPALADGPSGESAASLSQALDMAAATVARPGLGGLARLRGHPFIRLALSPSFSALWTAGVVSLFGDRVHQFALAAIVYGATGSPVALSLVFAAATLPNLVLGPLSGTLVDRWNQKQVLVVSDLLRAAIVVVIPIAVIVNVLFVYPLVFTLTSISIFFRPAREAVMPRIVPTDDLLTANSANWLAETLADIIGYPLAGLFVAFLGRSLPLAFWFDAASYLGSALLILTIAIPPVLRSEAFERPTVLADMRAGWGFLRHEAALFTNTLQAAIGQFTTGALIALTFLYAANVLQRGTLGTAAVWGFLEAGIGVGNLLGGLVIGFIGGRIAKGRLVIGGYTLYGACVVGLGLTGNVGLAVGLAVGMGIANMVFVIPSQTLFQQRAPRDMIGRVVGIRFSIVFGSLTLAMAVSGVLATWFGVASVLVAVGALTCVAGIAGLFVPALRDA